MTYAYTILYVPDVTATIGFYERAFGFQRQFVTPEGDYGELLSGQTKLAFAALELANSNLQRGFTTIQPKDKPPGVELGFVTENIEADFQRAISAGATEYEAIKTKPWGQRVGYVRDNNGFLIELCTPLEPK